MITDYNAQIEQILKRTEEKASKEKKDLIAPVAMFRIMLGAISKYVEKESTENEGFNEALSYEWKSAERMLKFVWGKAEELALPGNYYGMNAAACCLPEDIVYDWVNDYYFLDDKEAVEKERAEEARKKAEAEAKKKAEAEKLARAREKAAEKLSKEEGWEALSDEEKEKKITAEANKIKNRLGKKSSTTTKKKAEKKAETVETPTDTSEKEETAEVISTATTTEYDSGETEVAEKPEVQPANTTEEVEEEESDFTLFDLMKMRGGDLS